MKIKNVTLSLIMFLLVGCASIQTNWVDPAGRPLPDPSYTLNPIGTQMRVTFFYAAIKGTPDVDGSNVVSLDYLDMLKANQDIVASKYQGVCLIVQVHNPEQLKYSLYEKTIMRVGQSFKSTEVQTGGERHASNLPYRQFVYNLPFGEKVVDVDHLVILHINGEEALRIGNFRYHIIN